MTAPTVRLDHTDPLLLDFDATVIAHARWEGRAAVVLDRSAFYPESGGQLPDGGTLHGETVTDVQLDDSGAVLHLLGDRPVPAVGATVHGTVDRARRRYHMALHTGQHMLSRALLDEARAETVSSRLGATSSTIDVDLGVLADGDLARAESLVNAVIEDDRVVRAYFPDPRDLPGLSLRRAPKVTDNVRVVDIGGFDLSPCGGTHCTRTAQVGVLTVTGTERYKGRMRVSFLAGRGAVEELSARSRVLADMGRSFTCAPRDVPAGIERLRRDLQDARDGLGRLRGRLAETSARELLAAMDAAGTTLAVALFDNEPVDTLRAVATRITARPDAVAILASHTAEGTLVLAARGASSGFDCGAWLKGVAATYGGRGGGRPDRAEGRLPPDVPWDVISRAP